MSNNPKRPYSEVKRIADHIVASLAPYCERIELGGSLRRERPLIGDIEIVSMPIRQVDLFGNPAKGATALDVFLESKGIAFVKNGEKYKQFVYGRFTVDLFIPASLAHWGSIFLIRTGSHEFNLWIMNDRAITQRVIFDKGLLYRRESRELIHTETETAVFAALGMDYVPPQYRDGSQWLLYIKEGVLGD